ncbi:Uncharacterised protein [Mycobacteroides abscessus subsp. abscessus]|nr:Uncharacterised protein [Mycobacteroides abscessus subsp. abscessus]
MCLLSPERVANWAPISLPVQSYAISPFAP